MGKNTGSCSTDLIEDCMPCPDELRIKNFNK